MFDTGNIIPTKKALNAAKSLGIDLIALIQKHAACDWPNITAYEQILNMKAIENNRVVYSRYRVNNTIFIVSTDLRSSETNIYLLGEE